MAHQYHTQDNYNEYMYEYQGPTIEILEMSGMDKLTFSIH